MYFPFQIISVCPELGRIKKEARKLLNLSKKLTDHGNNCNIMLLSNLREPEWIPVHCHEKLLHFSICKFKNETNKTYNTHDYYFCKSTNLLFNDKCYILLWNITWNTESDFCREYQTMGISLNELTTLYHIFDAVSSVDTFPNIILQNHYQLHIIQIYKLFNRIHFKHIFKMTTFDSGHTICTYKRSKVTIGTNLFHCRKGGYILQKYVCDENKDCPNDSSDEDFCICDQIYENIIKRRLCRVLKTNQSITYCTTNYYVSMKGSCEKYDFTAISAEPNTGNIVTFKMSSCDNDESPNTSSADENEHNCGEKNKKDSLLLSSMHTHHHLLFHCMDSNTNFNLGDFCWYKLDKDNQMIPCRKGDHLENCAQFKCNTKFKCPGYYCINWSYVCDGKWDCPYGDDELNNDVCIGKKICNNMYKCSGVYRCISLGNVCDDHPDCIHKDDEMLCDLKFVQCSEACVCLSHAIACTMLKVKIFQFDFSVFMKVSIFESYIDSITTLENKLKNTYFVYLPRNNITTVCPLLFLSKLLLLDLQFNHLSEIRAKCLSVSAFLIKLNLNNNDIIYLSIYSFYDLYYLRFLDLSKNPFINVPSKCFYGIFSLKVLHLGKNKMKEIHVKAFVYSNIKIIKSVDYKISCICPKNAYCTSHPPWYASCSDILPGITFKTMYITISVSTISLNVMSILLQICRKHGNKNFKIKVIGLHLGDSLCGVYLFIIWIYDHVFQGVHLINEELWKTHPMCFVTHGLVLWFVISIPISLVNLSTTRLKAVLHPLETRMKCQKEAIYQVIIVHLFALCVSIFFTLVLQFTETHLPTNLCLPFIHPSGSPIFTKVVSWIIILNQSVVSILISVINIFLMKNVNKSVGSIQTSQSSNTSNYKLMLFQLMLTGISNMLCWFPANAVYILAMFLPVYPINLVIWTTVAIMPLNSVINPCIFILMNLKSIR